MIMNCSDSLESFINTFLLVFVAYNVTYNVTILIIWTLGKIDAHRKGW